MLWSFPLSLDWAKICIMLRMVIVSYHKGLRSQRLLEEVQNPLHWFMNITKDLGFLHLSICHPLYVCLFLSVVCRRWLKTWHHRTDTSTDKAKESFPPYSSEVSKQAHPEVPLDFTGLNRMLGCWVQRKLEKWIMAFFICPVAARLCPQRRWLGVTMK